MKRFKSKAGILALSGLMLANINAKALENEIKQKKIEKESIQVQMADKEDEIALYEKEIQAINQEIRVLDRLISQTQNEINLIQSQINELKIKIDENRLALEEARGQLSQYEEDLANRLRDQYMQGEVSYLDVLFGSEDITDFLKRVDIVQSVHKKDRELMELTDKQIDFIQKTEAVLIKQENELLDKRKIELDKINQLEMQNAQKSQQMSKLAQNKAFAQTEYETYSSQNNSLAQEIVSLENEMEARRKAEEERRRREAEERARLEASKKEASNNQSSSNSTGSGSTSKSSSRTYGSGRLSWPVPGNHRITSKYGYRIHPIFNVRKFHAGIDIGAPSGTPIVAADSGIVISAGWQGGYGNTVIVSHGKGISTLYAHNSALAVSVGDYVEKGETIAFCGSTGYSTGPHLHFEVRVNGSTTDPLGWL